MSADGSAARSGAVRQGDVVLAVDGVSARGMTVGQVTNLIRGTPFNNMRPVQIVFLRDAANGASSTVRYAKRALYYS